MWAVAEGATLVAAIGQRNAAQSSLRRSVVRCDTMYRMAINFSVRLDDDTERKLNELVEHFKATPTIGTVRRSDVVRVAIEQLHRDAKSPK